MVIPLSPADVARRIQAESSGVVLLDVREPDERAVAHIEPSVFIPMHEVPHRLAEIPRDRQIVVYCHHGTRSAMVAGFLEREGFARVANLTGGIDAWSRRVDPSIPRYS